MIFQNKVMLPLTKITDSLFRCVLGNRVIFVDDVTLITKSTGQPVLDRNGKVKDWYVQLPCNARIVIDSQADERVSLVSDPNWVCTVAEQTQVISNANGVMGSLRTDPAALESANLSYTFKNANNYNENIVNDLVGVIVSSRFDTIPDTVRHLVYSTLISKYGAVISADDEIGTGDVIENASVVNNLVIKTLNGVVDHGGIVELPNINAVISVKRKIWDTNAEYALPLSRHTFQAEDGEKTVDTDCVGFMTGLWDKILGFETEAAHSVMYALTFDKRTYKVFDQGWIDIVSISPDVHGAQSHTWHILVEGEWVDTGELSFHTDFVSQALDKMASTPKLMSLNELTEADINCENGFVMRYSSYFDIVFHALDNTSVWRFGLKVSETGFSEVTLGENGSYDVIRKHNKGKQTHTIVKLGVGMEEIVIDYI